MLLIMLLIINSLPLLKKKGNTIVHHQSDSIMGTKSSWLPFHMDGTILPTVFLILIA